MASVVLMVALARPKMPRIKSLLVGEQVVQHVEQLREHRCCPTRARSAGESPCSLRAARQSLFKILAGGGEQPSHLDEVLERSRSRTASGNGLRLERQRDVRMRSSSSFFVTVPV